MRFRIDGAALVVWAGVYEGAIPLEHALGALVVGIVAYVVARLCRRPIRGWLEVDRG
jgi:hypothetical protein